MVMTLSFRDPPAVISRSPTSKCAEPRAKSSGNPARKAQERLKAAVFRQNRTVLVSAACGSAVGGGAAAGLVEPILARHAGVRQGAGIPRTAAGAACRPLKVFG